MWFQVKETSSMPGVPSTVRSVSGKQVGSTDTVMSSMQQLYWPEYSHLNTSRAASAGNEVR